MAAGRRRLRAVGSAEHEETTRGRSRAEAAPPVTGASSVSDVFVSCAHEDQGVGGWCVDELTSQGRDVWVDWEGIPPSAKWRDEVRAAIEGSGAFVFVMTPHSLDSAVCPE